MKYTILSVLIALSTLAYSYKMFGWEVALLSFLLMLFAFLISMALNVAAAQMIINHTIQAKIETGRKLEELFARYGNKKG